MTFNELKTELVDTRFGEGKRTQCGRWLNHRMAMVWAAADWPFKKAERETAVVDADGLVTTPSSFRRMLWMETTDDQPVAYLTPAEFREHYPFSNTETATQPSIYTVNNGRIYVRPKNASSVVISYERKLCHLAEGTTVTAGVMNSDNDTPVWDEAHHYLLILGAMSTGLKTENDPTWEALEMEFQQALSLMREEYLPPDGVVNRQFGRIAD